MNDAIYSHWMHFSNSNHIVNAFAAWAGRAPETLAVFEGPLCGREEKGREGKEKKKKEWEWG